MRILFFWLFILQCLLQCLFAENSQTSIGEFDRENNRIFELFADSVDGVDSAIVVAKGNATLISQDAYIMADFIKYNTKTREAEVQGNAHFYKDGNLYFSTQSAKVNFDEKHYLIEPVYVQDAESGVWVSAKIAKGQGSKYEFDDPVVSACEISEPVWRIEGSSGTYNQDSSIVGIWNPRIYIKNVPVFWLPYIFLSTKAERSTGLLYPAFTLSTLEGFVYMQPFFIATHTFWDMTLTPQVRHLRGYGGNVELRFVDSANKLFYFNAGFFNNFDSYILKNNAQNKYIYGFDFKHERRGILSEFFSDYDDGLYLDFRYMNDLDYIRLQEANNKDIENRIQTSKANFFGAKGEHYAGLYFKYFLDLQNPTNAYTLHTLPHLQYHKYISQLGIKNLNYSIDFNTKNIMRYKGFGYVDNSLRVPLYFHLPIFAEFVTIGASLSANAGLITLNRANEISTKLNSKVSTYFNASYGLFLASDIAKHYDKFFHAMNFKAELSDKIYSYSDDENRIFTPELASNKEIYDTFFNNHIFSDLKPYIRLSFAQYFFGLEGNEILYHRVFQNIDLSQSGMQKFESLRNEIGITPIPNLTLTNTLRYSYIYNNLDEISFGLNFSYGYFKSSITYYLKQKFSGEFSKECAYYDKERKMCVEETANFLRAKVSQDFSYFTLQGEVGYDFSKNYLRDWTITIAKDIRCFGIGLKFANEITPILRTTGPDTIVNRYIGLEFRFVPVTSTSLKYNFKEN